MEYRLQSFNDGDLQGSPLPPMPGGQVGITAQPVVGSSESYDVTIVALSSFGRRELTITAGEVDSATFDALCGLLASPRSTDDPLPALGHLTKIYDVLAESGCSFDAEGEGCAYDRAACFIEAEIAQLPAEALRRAIVSREVAPGIVHLEFPHQALLADTMLRFQEHYESPQFHSTVFRREDFAAWYRSTQPHGGFSYHFDWPGFNVPARCFEPFRRGDFGALSSGEGAVLDTIALHRDVRMVIATFRGGDPETLRHEVAHGLFETVPEYRAEALRIVGTLERGPLYAVLESLGYARHTWDDEIQAYLLGDLDEIIPEGQIDPAWQGAAAELRTLFARYTDTPSSID